MVKRCSILVLRGNIVLYIAIYNNFALLLTLQGLLLVLEYLCQLMLVNPWRAPLCVNSDSEIATAMN